MLTANGDTQLARHSENHKANSSSEAKHAGAVQIEETQKNVMVIVLIVLRRRKRKKQEKNATEFI